MFSDLELDNYAVGIPAMLLVVIASALGHVLVKKFLSKEAIQDCHKVAGDYFQVVGTLYAIILGLVVVDALNKYETAATNLENESTSLMAVYMLSDQFIETSSEQKIKQLSKEYLDEILLNDWRLMSEGKKNYKARSILKELINTIRAIEPLTENQKAILPVLIEKSLDVWDYRRSRINTSEQGIPDIAWIMLLMGGLVTMIFTCFFTIDNHKAHTFMTGLVALVIIMNLYIALLFSEPYTGNFITPKKSLIAAQSIMNGTYFFDDTDEMIHHQQTL